MSDKHTGVAAFPFQIDLPNGDGSVMTHYNSGMTLRDYFAAKALAIAYDHFSRDLGGNQNDHDVDWNEDMILWAEEAYSLADAMLKAREA
jgi:hypothetical protein